jgi:hypothetical protein
MLGDLKNLAHHLHQVLETAVAITSSFSEASHLPLDLDSTQFVPLLRHLAHCAVSRSYLCPCLLFPIRLGFLPGSSDFLYLGKCLVQCSQHMEDTINS